MDFESEQDPAAEFLNRERAELGDLEQEIGLSNGKLILKFLLFSYLTNLFFSQQNQPFPKKRHCPAMILK
jgi:hypothetical protein